MPAMLATSPLPTNYISDMNKPPAFPPPPPPSFANPSMFLEKSEQKTVAASSCSSDIMQNSRDQSESPKRERRESGNDSDKQILKSSSSGTKKLKSRSRRKRRARIRKSKEEIFKMDLSDDDRETTPVNAEEDVDEKVAEPLGRTCSLPDILDLIEPIEDQEEKKVEKIKYRYRRLSSHSISYIPKHLQDSFVPSFHSRKQSVTEVQATKSEGQLTPQSTT